MSRMILLLASLALVPAASAAGPARKPGPDPTSVAADYAELTRDNWRASFPHLGDHEVLSPSTGSNDKPGAYNCIAHSLRVYDRWVWPGTTVEEFDRLFYSHGFKRIGLLDYAFKGETEKVVLYAKFHGDGRIECTHAAKQLADGTWTSKLGSGPLIRHSSPDALAGPSYGQPAAVYVRARKTAKTTAAKKSPANPSRAETE